MFLAREHARQRAALDVRTAELADARSRLVSAADRERIRIERDLHDGAQQRLIVLMVDLARLEEHASGLSEDLAEGLARARQAVAATIDEIRGLVHGSGPDDLRRLGVSTALSGLARRMPFDVRLHGTCGTVPADVGTALYFCCLEALQNAAKHSGARRVDIRFLRHADGSLEFAVADDGAGFDPARLRHARGIANIRDRLGALGGELTIVSAPGAGTVVTGRVPAASLLETSAARREASGRPDLAQRSDGRSGAHVA